MMAHCLTRGGILGGHRARPTCVISPPQLRRFWIMVGKTITRWERVVIGLFWASATCGLPGYLDCGPPTCKSLPRRANAQLEISKQIRPSFLTVSPRIPEAFCGGDFNSGRGWCSWLRNGLIRPLFILEKDTRDWVSLRDEAIGPTPRSIRRRIWLSVRTACTVAAGHQSTPDMKKDEGERGKRILQRRGGEAPQAQPCPRGPL